MILPSNKSQSRIHSVLNELSTGLALGTFEFLINLDGPAQVYEHSIRSLNIGSVKIFRESGPLSEVLNHLIDESDSELIARADDDDIYLPGRLKTQIDFMDHRKEVGVCGSAMYLQQDHGIRGVKYYPEYHDAVATSFLFNCHGIAHPVVTIRRNQLSKLRYRNCAAEDMDLWVRMIAAGVYFSNINIPLFVYSMPHYSIIRASEMAASVLGSVEYLMEKYFMCQPSLVHALAPVFFDQSTPKELSLVQREFLASFLNAPFFNGNAGRNLFISSAKRYNSRLFGQLTELIA